MSTTDASADELAAGWPYVARTVKPSDLPADDELTVEMSLSEAFKCEALLRAHSGKLIDGDLAHLAADYTALADKIAARIEADEPAESGLVICSTGESEPMDTNESPYSAAEAWCAATEPLMGPERDVVADESTSWDDIRAHLNTAAPYVLARYTDGTAAVVVGKAS